MTRRFRLVWFTQLISVFGSAVSGFGAAIWIFTESGGYAALGAFMAAVSAAELAATPFSAVVDRFGRRTVMIVGDSAAAVVTSGLLALWATDALTPLLLAVGGVAISFASQFQVTAYTAAIPDLVDPDDLERANGLVQLGPAIAIVAGPAAASAIFGVGGVGAILAVDLVTFAVGLFGLVVSRFRSRAVADDGDDGSMRSALRWLRTTPGRPLLVLIATASVVNFALGAFSVVALGRAAELGGESRAGWPLAAGGALMVVVSIVIGSTGTGPRRVPLLAASFVWFGVFIALAGSRPSLAVLVGGVALGLAAIPVAQAVATTLFHERVPPAMLGRVFGIRSAVGMVLLPIGSLVGGRAAAVSPAFSLAAVGAALVVAGVVVASSRSVAQLDRTAPVENVA